MKDLLPQAMKAKAERLISYAESSKTVDFAAILTEVIQARRLRELSRAIKFSHSQLHTISQTGREPRYSVGVNILEWVRVNFERGR